MIILYLYKQTDMIEKEDLEYCETCASIEDIQDSANYKLAKVLSFYNEQEFLDEMNGVNIANEV